MGQDEIMSMRQDETIKPLNVVLSELGANGSWDLLWEVSANAMHSLKTADAATDLIRKMLNQFVLHESSSTDWRLSIPTLSDDGFDVDLMKRHDCIFATFGGLQEEFPTLAIALVWLRRALCRDYRLSITIVGGKPRQWRLEPALTSAEPALFLAYGDVSLFSFLRPKSVVMRQNLLV